MDGDVIMNYVNVPMPPAIRDRLAYYRTRNHFKSYYEAVEYLLDNAETKEHNHIEEIKPNERDEPTNLDKITLMRCICGEDIIADMEDWLHNKISYLVCSKCNRKYNYDQGKWHIG